MKKLYERVNAGYHLWINVDELITNSMFEKDYFYYSNQYKEVEKDCSMILTFLELNGFKFGNRNIVSENEQKCSMRINVYDQFGNSIGFIMLEHLYSYKEVKD